MSRGWKWVKGMSNNSGSSSSLKNTKNNDAIYYLLAPGKELLESMGLRGSTLILIPPPPLLVLQRLRRQYPHRAPSSPSKKRTEDGKRWTGGRIVENNNDEEEVAATPIAKEKEQKERLKGSNPKMPLCNGRTGKRMSEVPGIQWRRRQRGNDDSKTKAGQKRRRSKRWQQTADTMVQQGYRSTRGSLAGRNEKAGAERTSDNGLSLVWAKMSWVRAGRWRSPVKTRRKLKDKRRGSKRAKEGTTGLSIVMEKKMSHTNLHRRDT